MNDLIDHDNPNRFVCPGCGSDDVYDPSFGWYLQSWLDRFGRFLDDHASCRERLTVEGA